MPEPSSDFAEVRFIDYERVLAGLRAAAARARAEHPEILHVFLFGSLVRGNWTADSDADLIVVVRRQFADLFERTRYQIWAESIPTDTLVYSEEEFQRLLADKQSFLSANLQSMLQI